MVLLLSKVGALLFLVSAVASLPLTSEEYDIEEYVIEIEEDYPDSPAELKTNSQPAHRRRGTAHYSGTVNDPQIGHRFDTRVSTLSPDAFIWGPASIDSSVIQQAIEEDNEIGLSWDEISALQNEFGRRLSPGRAYVPLLRSSYRSVGKPAKSKPQVSNFHLPTTTTTIATTAQRDVADSAIVSRTAANRFHVSLPQSLSLNHLQSSVPTTTTTTTTESPSTFAQRLEEFANRNDGFHYVAEAPHLPEVFPLDQLTTSSNNAPEQELHVQSQTSWAPAEQPTTPAVIFNNWSFETTIRNELSSETTHASEHHGLRLSSTTQPPIETTTPLFVSSLEPVASTTVSIATASARRGIRLFSTPTPAADAGTDAAAPSNSLPLEGPKPKRPNFVVRKRIRTTTEPTTTDAFALASQPAVAESGNIDFLELPQANTFRQNNNRGRLTFKQSIASTEASVQAIQELKVTEPTTDKPEPTTNAPFIATTNLPFVFPFKVPAGAQRVFLATNDLPAVSLSSTVATEEAPVTEPIHSSTSPAAVSEAPEATSEVPTTRRNPFIARNRVRITTTATTPIPTTSSPDSIPNQPEVPITTSNPLPGRRVNGIRPVTTTLPPVTPAGSARPQPTVRFIRGRRLNTTQVQGSTTPSRVDLPIQSTELPSVPVTEVVPTTFKPNFPIAGFSALPITTSNIPDVAVEVTSTEGTVAEEVVGTVIDSATGVFGQRRRTVSKVGRS